MNSWQTLAKKIKNIGEAHGFQEVGITNIDLSLYKNYLDQWLAAGYHADMDYMHKHGSKRTEPQQLVPGTLRVISLRMNYLPQSIESINLLDHASKAYISRYALGRDYHKTVRRRLAKIAEEITELCPSHEYRVFVDSAPVLEKALAEKSGLGWIGKNTLLLNRQAGSWFFLGEIYTNLPLPIDNITTNHCGSCQSCIDVCPTQAIVKPYTLDARRCISYLTIENKGAIPEAFRIPMGNRIFGCDDCQLYCPWNKFAQPTEEADFSPRHELQHAELIELFQWSEDIFLTKTQGSPIRRTGYMGWLRNISIALGNAEYQPKILACLEQKANHHNIMLREHIAWAIHQQQRKQKNQNPEKIIPHLFLQSPENPET